MSPSPPTLREQLTNVAGDLATVQELLDEIGAKVGDLALLVTDGEVSSAPLAPTLSKLSDDRIRAAAYQRIPRDEQRAFAVNVLVEAAGKWVNPRIEAHNRGRNSPEHAKYLASAIRRELLGFTRGEFPMPKQGVVERRYNPTIGNHYEYRIVLHGDNEDAVTAS